MHVRRRNERRMLRGGDVFETHLAVFVIFLLFLIFFKISFTPLLLSYLPASFSHDALKTPALVRTS
jgi:hypothetical protein